MARDWLRGSVTAALLAAAMGFACGSEAAEDSKPAVPVEASKVVAAPLSEQVTAIGTLLSDEAVTISSEIAGRLKEIHFEEGQPVEKGALLFSLDNSVYRAQLDDASAKLKLAAETNKRTSTLFSNKYATAQSADEAASNLAVNTAAVELARVSSTRAITAPFAGIVGLRHVSAGEYITAGQALVNLEAIDPVKADFRVPEKFLPAIRVGQTIKIKVDAFPEDSFEGQGLRHRSPPGRRRAEPSRPRDGAQSRPAAEAGAVRAGDRASPAQGGCLERPRAGHRAARRKAVHVQDRRRQGEAHQGKVGTRREGRVEIVEGLAAGDQVVTAGQLRSKTSVPVTIAATGA